MNSQNIDRRYISHERLIEALIDGIRFIPATVHEDAWHRIISRLPDDLQEALLYELQHGNSVNAIQVDDWPQVGSIVVCMAEDFKGDYSEGNRFNVTYRLLDDPHYWHADIHQVINGVEHLIIN